YARCPARPRPARTPETAAAAARKPSPRSQRRSSAAAFAALHQPSPSRTSARKKFAASSARFAWEGGARLCGMGPWRSRVRAFCRNQRSALGQQPCATGFSSHHLQATRVPVLAPAQLVPLWGKRLARPDYWLRLNPWSLRALLVAIAGLAVAVALRMVLAS